jgi:hypothetical protein
MPPEALQTDFGLYVGLVEDTTQDELAQGYVRVTIEGRNVSGVLAPVVMVGHPFNRGVFAVPTEGSRVLVGYLQGEPDNPVVLGGFPPPVAEGSSRNQVAKEDLTKFTRFENADWEVVMGNGDTEYPYMRIGHREAGDADDDPVQNLLKNLSITLDREANKIEIVAPVDIVLKTHGNITLSCATGRITDPGYEQAAATSPRVRVFQKNGQPI